MKKMMIKLTILCLIAMILSYLGYYFFALDIYFSLFITFFTTLYHLLMRLMVGYILINHVFDYHHQWFQPLSFEHGLYKCLRVHEWKKYMPTWNSEAFSFHDHTLEEIIETMCGSEIVHEMNMVLSFVPLLFSLIVGDFWVFFITSLIGSLMDFSFVIIQRYNRPRIMKLLKRKIRSTIS